MADHLRWYHGFRGGLSSNSIGFHLCPDGRDYFLGRLAGWGTAHRPHDWGDVGRCIELLDRAGAAGVNLRSRMGEMAVVPGWKRLALCWPLVEEVHALDSVDPPARGPYRTYWLLEHIQGRAEAVRFPVTELRARADALLEAADV